MSRRFEKDSGLEMQSPTGERKGSMVARVGLYAKRVFSQLNPPTAGIPLRNLGRIREEVARTAGLVLDVGCGRRWISDEVVRVDIEPSSDLSAVADAQRLPFGDATFDLVVCSEVLEHIPEWHLARDEIVRVTKPGGRVMVDVPFMYPYHPGSEADGHDYTRWTRRGLRHMFEGLEVLEEGSVVGHGSMLAVALRESIARLFLGKNHSGVYYFARAWLSWLLYPLTLLDSWFEQKPRSEVMGGAFYILVQKPNAGANVGHSEDEMPEMVRIKQRHGK